MLSQEKCPQYEFDLFLFRQSLLDGKGLRAVQASARAVEDAFNKENYSQATELWSATEDTVDEASVARDF